MTVLTFLSVKTSFTTRPFRADQMLRLARLPNLSIGALLLVLIGWWAFRLWGAKAAMLAMALACFEPNFVAHSALVTTDIGAALFIFLTVYLLWEYFSLPTWWLLGAAGGSLGVALVSKFSAIVLIPMIGLIIALHLISTVGQSRAFLPRRHPIRLSARVIDATAVFVSIAFFAALVIPSAYSFQGFQPWFAGLKRFLQLAHEGQPAFFLGEYSYQGWRSYYLVAFLIKTPLGSLILMAVSILLCRIGRSLERREMIFLFIPVLVILLATLQAKVNIGLRHILPIYPFLFVLASRVATVRFSARLAGASADRLAADLHHRLFAPSRAAPARLFQ